MLSHVQPAVIAPYLANSSVAILRLLSRDLDRQSLPVEGRRACGGGRASAINRQLRGVSEWRSGFARRDDEFAETHEINVTPFIDVMLVLLIIFMVAAPLATVDVPVNLPSASAEPAPRPEKPIFVTFKADRSLAVDDDEVMRANLAAALDTVTGSDRTQRVLLRADQALSYGEVMELMNLLRNAGYVKVALVALEIRSGP